MAHGRGRSRRRRIAGVVLIALGFTLIGIIVVGAAVPAAVTVGKRF